MSEHDPQGYDPFLEYKRIWDDHERHKLALDALENEADRLRGMVWSQDNQSFHERWFGNRRIQVMLETVILRGFRFAHHIIINDSQTMGNNGTLTMNELFLPKDEYVLHSKKMQIVLDKGNVWDMNEDAGPLLQSRPDGNMDVCRGKKYKSPLHKPVRLLDKYQLCYQENNANEAAAILGELSELSLEPGVIVLDPDKRQ